MLYNLDKYNIKEYNQFLLNYKKHNVIYNEYVSTKNYQFVLETASYPEILDYTTLNKTQSIFLVSKVKAVVTQDENKLKRKNITNNASNLEYCKNDAYIYFSPTSNSLSNSSSKSTNKSVYFYFLNIPNKEQAQKLSKSIGRIYFLGKYLRYSIYLTNNQYTAEFVNLDDILVGDSDIFNAEIKLNYEVFRLQTRLKKFSMTPYFEAGNLVLPKTTHNFFKTGLDIKVT